MRGEEWRAAMRRARAEQNRQRRNRRGRRQDPDVDVRFGRLGYRRQPPAAPAGEVDRIP